MNQFLYIPTHEYGIVIGNNDL
jgi:hypothetical protein